MKRDTKPTTCELVERECRGWVISSYRCWARYKLLTLVNLSWMYLPSYTGWGARLAASHSALNVLYWTVLSEMWSTGKLDKESRKTCWKFIFWPCSPIYFPSSGHVHRSILHLLAVFPDLFFIFWPCSPIYFQSFGATSVSLRQHFSIFVKSWGPGSTVSWLEVMFHILKYQQWSNTRFSNKPWDKTSPFDTSHHS